MTQPAPQPDSSLVSGVRYFISDGTRTLELHHALSHSVTDGNSAEVVVNAAGKAFGKSATGGGYTINLKVRSSQNRREVAWKRLQKSKANFRFDIQSSAKRRDQYVDCWVSNVAESGGNGDYSLDITIIAIDVEPIDL